MMISGGEWGGWLMFCTSIPMKSNWVYASFTFVQYNRTRCLNSHITRFSSATLLSFYIQHQTKFTFLVAAMVQNIFIYKSIHKHQIFQKLNDIWARLIVWHLLARAFLVIYSIENVCLFWHLAGSMALLCQRICHDDTDTACIVLYDTHYVEYNVRSE